MCGICGFNWEDKALVKSMADAILHRGPDGHGYYVDKNISLGHRRLSIIDLSARGKQPMYNQDGSICIVFNGEIYNYKEIKQKLENKYKFFSETDTEAIIHAYEEYGEDCLQYLNGMFAFAIWDSRKKSLFLARDRIGIKPLYYYFKDGKFIFGSEIKAILEYPISREVNISSLYQFLTFSYIPYPATLFKDIYKLPPAHYIVLKDNKLKIKKYWDIAYNEINKPLSYYTEELFNRFRNSVEMQLMSDVPLGAYLSGGLDSSSIVAMMSSLMDRPVTTFSVGFESDEVINELYYAKKVADKLNTNHNEIIVNPDDAIKILPKIIWHLDEPIANPASIPLYFMSQAAKKKMTVVLTGNGGDELFAGYKQHKVISLANNHYKKYPFLFDSKLSLSFINTFNKFTPEKSNYKKYINFLSKFLPILKHMPSAYNLLVYRNFTDDERIQLLETGNSSTNLSVKQAQNLSKNLIGSFFNTKNNILNQLLSIDLKLLLPEDYLMVDDKINMANSIESRVPFLDHTLVEFAATIPVKYKFNGLTGKFILKKTMKNLLPKEVIQRKKYGFTPPLTLWINKHLKSEACNILLDSDSEVKRYFNHKFLKNILTDNTKKHYNKILPLLMFGQWYDLYLFNNQNI